MLKVVTLTENWIEGTPCVLALGGFDGLHVGHREVLARAKGFSLPVGVMTIAGGKGQSLFTLEERRDIFCRAGADFVFELDFEEIKGLSYQCFAEGLCRRFDVRAFVCGEDFRFGAGAQGTPEKLKRSTHVRVEVQKLCERMGRKVSSTAVKALLEDGRAEAVSELLGEPFFVRGEVCKDRQVGRTIGFPTANVAYPLDKFPLKKGVYESAVEIDGVAYKGITNFGARPTFGDESVWTETYLDGFSGDLYGRTIDVRFVRFLREIERFDGATELKKQLCADIRRVRNHD